MSDFASPISPLFGENPSAAYGIPASDIFLTFPPTMHVPCPKPSAYHVYTEPTMDPLSIMHDIQAQQPRVAPTIDAYGRPQRIDMPLTGTFYTDPQSRVYNEFADPTFPTSNMPSSSSVLLSPSFKRFLVLPLLDHSTMYPEAASLKTLVKPSSGEETGQDHYDEELLARSALAETSSGAIGPVSGQEFSWDRRRGQQVRRAPEPAFSSNGESILNQHFGLGLDVPSSTSSNVNDLFMPAPPNLSHVSNAGLIQGPVYRDRDLFISLAQTFASDQARSPLFTPSLSTPGLTTSPYSAFGVGIESSGPSAPVSPDHYRRYPTTNVRPTVEHSARIAPTRATDARERTLTARWLEDRTSGQPPGPIRNHRHHATAPMIARTAPRVSVPVQEGTNIPIDAWFRHESDLWRRMILDRILVSPFLLNKALEPRDKGRGDPITGSHGEEGVSIYGVFIEKVGGGEWICAFRTVTRTCPTSTVFKRFERAVEHVRSHLDHRPFPCPGTCSHGANCTKRFVSKQYLRDHLGRKSKIACSICDKVVLLQNLTRHINLCHPHAVIDQ